MRILRFIAQHQHFQGAVAVSENRAERLEAAILQWVHSQVQQLQAGVGGQPSREVCSAVSGNVALAQRQACQSAVGVHQRLCKEHSAFISAISRGEIQDADGAVLESLGDVQIALRPEGVVRQLQARQRGVSTQPFCDVLRPCVSDAAARYFSAP